MTAATSTLAPGRASDTGRASTMPASPGARMRPNAVVLAALGFVGFVAVWEAVLRFGVVNPMMLPSPAAIPAAFVKELTSGAWVEAIRDSLSHYLAGLALGSALGILLGVAAGLFASFEAATAWIVRVLRPIPGLAWVPFAILWFGVSTGAATFIVAVGVFWINFFAALAAVQAVDRDLHEVGAAFGYRSRASRLLPIVLPAAAPGILGGLRTGLGQAWMAVVAAELFGVPGIGQRMMQASNLLATDIVIVYMLTMALLYGVVDALFVFVRDRVLTWKA